MERVEHYCDVCGKQMTKLDADGNQQMSGMQLAASDPLGAIVSKLIVLRVACYRKGDPSKAILGMETLAKLTKTEFCSYECFQSAINAWLSSCQRFFQAPSSCEAEEIFRSGI